MELLPTLGRITRSLASNRPLDAILKRVARDIAKVSGADSCSILLVDEEHRQLLFKEAAGLSRWELDHIRFKMGEGVAGWVARTRRPARIADVARDKRFKSFPGQDAKIVSMLCAPLLLHGRVLGVICLSSSKRSAFGRDDELMLTHLAGHTALEIENHRLYELAVTDPLTGLFNRRYFERRLEDELGRARRFHETLAICLADLDSFKVINDEHGHPAGDEVLVSVSKIFTRQLRAYDVAARIGGDEFAFVFLNTPEEKLPVITDRLRTSLSGGVTTPSGTFMLSASLGAAVFPDDGPDARKLLAVADSRLYGAKPKRRKR